MLQILVAEDDRNTRRLMEAVLKEYDYRPIPVCDGLKALKLLNTHHVDLVILDIMMSGMDDYKLTRQLGTADYTLLVLVVTAKQLPEGKQKGFIVGTDDYMTKSMDEEEMILCTRALLHRAQIVNERRITISDVRLDCDSLTVSRGNESQTLPCKEFYLPYKLLSYSGKIFTRIQFMDEIWGMESQSDDNTINTHIDRLRKHSKDYPELAVETTHDPGYKAVKNL